MTLAVVALRALPRVADDRLLAPRADLGELRVLLDLEAPALVLREVPVKGVQLEDRHDVDVLLDELDREEVSADIEVQAAVAEPRGILDPHARHAAGRRELAQRLTRVVETAIGARADLGALRRHVEDVRLVALDRRIEPGRDGIALREVSGARLQDARPRDERVASGVGGIRHRLRA